MTTVGSIFNRTFLARTDNRPCIQPFLAGQGPLTSANRNEGAQAAIRTGAVEPAQYCVVGRVSGWNDLRLSSQGIEC